MLDWLERNPFLVLALAGLLILGGLAAGELEGPDSPQPIVFRHGAGVTPGAPIKVHVAGAVSEPGVYTMQGGDRIEDGLSAAGGPLAEADLDALNLAHLLRDGEQIAVPFDASSAAALVTTRCPAPPIDLNTATQDDLMCLPGIGEAYSRRIVDSRTVDGPFAAVDDLLARNLMPASILDAIRDLVFVAEP